MHGRAQSCQALLEVVHRHVVGQRLARMTEVSQAVDHGNRRDGRKPLDNVVRERTDHEAADHPVERPCHVLERFAPMQVDFVRAEIDRLRSELIGRHLKRHRVRSDGFSKIVVRVLPASAWE